MQDDVSVNPVQPENKKQNTGLVLTIINTVLILGLAVLYFIVLNPNKTANETTAQKTLPEGKTSIAYVNSDSILVHYQLVKSMREELERNTINYENELKNKQSAFEKDAAYFQEQVKKNAISEASAQEIYANLMTEQQKLYELREKYTSDIARKEFDMNQLLLDSLNNFLKRYNQKMNYDYIFSYNRGGSILSANDSLDITDDVIVLLNSEYSSGGTTK